MVLLHVQIAKENEFLKENKNKLFSFIKHKLSPMAQKQINISLKFVLKRSADKCFIYLLT